MQSYNRYFVKCFGFFFIFFPIFSFKSVRFLVSYSKVVCKCQLCPVHLGIMKNVLYLKNGKQKQ